VPPEESSAPGMALGVGAGMLEEAGFRLGLPAVGFRFARRHCSPVRAEALAVLVTSLAFALSHELGPGSPGFDPRIFATRFIVPGCLMSGLFFRPGPSFLLTLHCSLHVGIALLFPGRSLAASQGEPVPIPGPPAHIHVSVGHPERSIPFYAAFFGALGYRRWNVSRPELLGSTRVRAGLLRRLLRRPRRREAGGRLRSGSEPVSRGLSPQRSATPAREIGSSIRR